MMNADSKPTNHHKYRVYRFVVIIPYGHSAATNMLLNGTDIKTASEILGHASTTITHDIYVHVLDSTKLDAVEKMTAAIYATDSDENHEPDKTKEMEQKYVPTIQVVSVASF